jgi:hypothetical protein
MLLIISKNKKNARSISDTFHYMSILSYVATPHEALSEISNLYRAVLIFNPEGLADVKDYVKRIKSYKSDLPIFALTPYEVPIYYHDIFEKCFPMSTFTPALANEIIDYANKNSLKIEFEYVIIPYKEDYAVGQSVASGTIVLKNSNPIIIYLSKENN